MARYIATTTVGVLFSFRRAAQLNSLRGIFKVSKNRRSYATSVRLSCPLSRFKSRTCNHLRLLFQAVA